MKPPPIVHPPQRPVDPVVQGFVLGGIWIVVSVFSEWLTKPVVPFYQIFQLIPVAIGLGVGCGVLSSRYRWGTVVRILVSVFFLYEIIVNRLSLMTLFLFLGVNYLTVAGLALAARHE